MANQTSSLLHDLVCASAKFSPDAPALKHRGLTLNYRALDSAMQSFAQGLINLGLERHDRVAIFLPKQSEAVIAMFGAPRAGLVFVPVNPILKAAQVEHILRDCGVRVLVTSPERADTLREALGRLEALRHLVLVAEPQVVATMDFGVHTLTWSEMLGGPNQAAMHRVIDTDIAAIFYTSGSTGKPKGVVLSHRNMVTGAASVVEYLKNTTDDRLLAVLPFSFDYGFSQLSTAFTAGASVLLMEHLFARDILQLAAQEQPTALAGVPPLWSQLADLEWPAAAVNSIRYITNSGGAMPAATLQKLRRVLPKTQVFLMYGLTEAFRSTYLPPAELDRRAGSIGKAIPNAEILVVRPDGTRCAPNEPGELVHRGSLVSLGYWNDPAKTAERFRLVPSPLKGLVLDEIAVWSGDTVKADEDGYLYFVGRRDEMIKTSGYRVSPSEIEEVLFATGLVADAVAVGVPHVTLGQAIAVIAAAAPNSQPNTKALLDACRKELPAFMVPALVEWRDSLPRNPNGKYDRVRLAAEVKQAEPEPKP